MARALKQFHYEVVPKDEPDPEQQRIKPVKDTALNKLVATLLQEQKILDEVLGTE